MAKPDKPGKPGEPDRPAKPTKPAKLWELLDEDGDAVVDANGDPVEVVILDKLERGKVLVREIVSGVTHEIKHNRLFREEEDDDVDEEPEPPLAPVA